MQDFEKLGQFYLGREYDLSAKKGDENALVLYDAKDLVTHAVCVGMTGSGKTGLCLGLIEEAAIDGVPSIVIDPKGDLSNLLLTFPALRPEDFRPWINEDDARRKGLSPDDYAKAQAELWSKGLASWGQLGDRIAKLRGAAEIRVYTPGSNAGFPVSVLKSLSAPPAALVEDGELFRERVSSTATSLLGLMGISADPLSSREHILISNLLSRSWSDGVDMDLSTLIAQIQTPPPEMQRLGVMELEGFFPASERFGLAMRLNNLLASPGFSSWMEGEALDIGSMLAGESGKPRVAIFSIAHLSDAERMFFVSMLFNQVLAWTRQQSGTTSLRALVYMDEIAGYFPPVANPPSKGPMLTLMKQARAFGVGMVFATQNPVDIDYKGLSNAGTWFIGRLQTERDKMRVLDGLEGAMSSASARFDRAWADKTLSTLGPRQFLMNNVHEDGPVVFETRWCLSYLRGPLTRQQIKVLMDPVKAGGSAAGGAGFQPMREGAPTASVGNSAPAPAPALAPKSTASSAAPGSHRLEAGATQTGATSNRPVLPAEIPQFFLPTRQTGSVAYSPVLFATARVLYRESKLGIDTEESVAMIVPMSDGAVTVDWDHAEETDLVEGDLEREPSSSGASFAALPSEASRAKSYESWKKSFADAVFRNHALELQSCPALKLVSAAGEKPEAFKARVAHALRERRDEQAEKLKAKYAPKLTTLQERLRKAEQAVEVQKEQASGAKWGTALSAGAAILGAFLGRKTVSAGNIGRATTAARGVSRTMKESSDVGRAEETVEAVRQQAADLQSQFDADLASVSEEIDALGSEIETVSLRPKKTNISVRAVVLAWRAG